MTAVAFSWDWLRQLRGRVAAPARAAAERERTLQPPIEFERGASRELLAVDRFVRALYAGLCGDGRTVAGLLTDGARFDLGGCRWCPPGVASSRTVESGADVPRAPAARLVERVRTVHVVADVALVVSTCDAVRGAEAWVVVNCMQLRRSSTGWLLHEMVSREDTYAASERTADPRRPALVRPAGR